MLRSEEVGLGEVTGLGMSGAFVNGISDLQRDSKDLCSCPVFTIVREVGRGFMCASLQTKDCILEPIFS